MAFRTDRTVFQQNAVLIGRQYEIGVAEFLVAQGWSINERNTKRSFFEIDIIATDPNNHQIWLECKSGNEDTYSKNPGLMRNDTVQKAIGKAFGLMFVPNRKPYWLVTSHLPNEGTSSDFLLRRALDHGLINKIWLLKFDEKMQTVQEIIDNKDQLTLDF